MRLLGVFEVSEYIVHVVGKEGGLLQIDCIDDPNYFSPCTYVCWGLPQWLSSKESTCNAGSKSDVGSIPGSERSPRGGHDNPLKYSCLENPMDRGAWWATVHEAAKSRTWLKRLSTQAPTMQKKAREYSLENIRNIRADKGKHSKRMKEWKKKVDKREEKLKRVTKKERNGRRRKWAAVFPDPEKLLVT